MALTAEQRIKTAKRLQSTLIAQMALIRMAGGIDPRPVLKARYDTLPTPDQTGMQTTALNTLLGTDRTQLSPEEFNDMVNAAYQYM